MPLLETKGAASAQGFGFTLGGAQPLYIEDVFSTWLYTGNGSTQTINNGIDLAGKGGMLWIKSRSNAYNHWVVDSNRGTGNDKPRIQTNTTAAQSLIDSTAFLSNGFTVYGDSDYNGSGSAYASWTFRKAPKFFDVVTYTGDSVPGRQIAHNLGSVPGCIIVKRTDNIGEWVVWHRGLTDTFRMVLNTTAAQTSANFQNYFGDGTNYVAPTATNFTLGTNASVNGSGSGHTYVAYLFAHNAGGFGLTGTDNVISCGSFTTDGGGNATVNLGYEPQYVMYKSASTAGGAWQIFDSMRGLTMGADNTLSANASTAEGTGTDWLTPSATGFSTVGASFYTSETYIYIAIRRGPMKTPTSGTSVFAPVSYSGTGTTNSISSGFVVDAEIVGPRDVSRTWKSAFASRLTGTGRYLTSSSTAAEQTDGPTEEFATNNGVLRNGTGMNSTADSPLLTYMLQRAPGFFDVVCYTGTGSSLTLNHNLGVTPELVISKRRSGVYDWTVYSSARGTANTLFLNLTNAETAYTSVSAATATTFTVEGVASAGGETFVAYLFASCPGVSKVGSYTGNGSSQTINCGFAAGARFVLIKRTDSTGDWYVWDSARGITSGNDPYLLLNSTAAEVTGTNYVDTAASGFQITSSAPAAINASGGSFIFLAIA